MPDVEVPERRTGTLEALSPIEAAYVAAVSRKTVDQAIDRGEVRPARSRRASDSPRALEFGAVIYLRLREEAGPLLSSEGKRLLYKYVYHLTPRNVPETIDLGSVSVRTGPAVEQVTKSLDQLQATRHYVVTDPAIRGGEPVVRDTRIPVYLIADMVAQGEDRENILAAYPALSTEALEAVVLYARLHPRRGRPRTAPWRDRAPVRVITPDGLGERK
ncbi:MAG TPA: DUF433 domain-containing protein [Longimicrobiaceae bacterium]